MSGIGFPRPFEVEIPPECEGWEEMYGYFNLFGEERREFDEGRTWFQLASHYAEPWYPFDATYLDYFTAALNTVITRVLSIPPSRGFEQRILNGYAYHSPNAVTDGETLAHRADAFARRGGYCYEHWEELLVGWQERVDRELRELGALEVPTLPELEDESLVTGGGGVDSRHTLLLAYDGLLEGFDRACHYHIEYILLSYGAYLAFYETCRQAFPGIPDHTATKMVSGIETAVLRPDDELRRLARLAVELGVVEAVRASAGDEERLRGLLAGSDAGRRWLADLDRTKDPWFNFSYGNGLYHHHRSWIDDPTLPLATIGSYAERHAAGEDIARPTAAIEAERERITAEFRELVPDELRPVFDEQLALCRLVFPHVESHGFYIDHWYHTLFWNKVREFGALLARHAFLADSEDVFFLRRDEVRSALEELRLAWSSGVGEARGPRYWPPLVARRKRIYEAMRRWTPPRALGPVPDEIADPLLVLFLGITTERVREWAAPDAGDAGVLRGFAASPGIAEGRARVVFGPDSLGELEQGEILVAASTSPSWTPVFGRIAAAVLDTGGIMSHAAIVAREYGLPAVLGTGTATKRIRTGDRLRVDANTGVVTIL